MWRLTDAQRELRDSIRTFAQEVVRPAMLDVDERSDQTQASEMSVAIVGLIRPSRGAGGEQALAEVVLDRRDGDAAEAGEFGDTHIDSVTIG